MAIIITCKNSVSLRNSIIDAIMNGIEDSWIIDEMGDFTLSSPQFKYEAWLRPNITDTGIVFGIIGQENVKLTSYNYAIFHSRFVEFLLFHFDDSCENISISPMPTIYDSF